MYSLLRGINLSLTGIHPKENSAPINLFSWSTSRIGEIDDTPTLVEANALLESSKLYAETFSEPITSQLI